MVRAIPTEVLKFAAEVGSEGPVVVVGGGTHSAALDLATSAVSGQTADAASGQAAGAASDQATSTTQAREVRAPAGIWEYEPSEMTVRCGAGTTLAQLDAALAANKQMVPFDASAQATVGGVLATGLSGYRRLRYGHVRDLVLQTRHVDHSGQVVTAGGPTVKNVSGYDLCRLLVGSWGTLGFLGEVILRCLPIPAASQWLTGRVDPFEVRDLLYRPSSILWDGDSTWVLLEGHGDDVASEAAKLLQMRPTMTPTEAGLSGAALSSAGLSGAGLSGAGLPEWLSKTRRMSLRPSQLRNLKPGPTTSWLAEVGVGVVHYQGDRPEGAQPASANQPSPGQSSSGYGDFERINATLGASIKQRLDPLGRLNPGQFS